MGISISNLLQHFFGKEELRILMVGLDAAGKTTILYKLKVGEVVTTIPTIGFNVETVEFKNIRFTVWDVGGQQRIRSLWHHYYSNTAGVIFVMDASDRERIAEAAEELHMIMEEDQMRNAVLLVFANKQDLPQALSITEVVEHMQLHKIKQDWHVHATCAIQGTGLYDGLEYLREMLNKRRRRKNFE